MKFNIQLFAEEESATETTVTTTEETTTTEAEETTGTTVDGVDLSKLTADQLAALTKEEWEEVKTVFQAAVKARAEDEWSKIKEKLSAVVTGWKTYALPVVKYGAGLYVVAKIAGVI